MGARFSSMWKAPPAKIVMLGLDAAGKTTIMYKMQAAEVQTTIPTIGFNVETIKTSGLELVSWDVGGRDKIRPLWRHFMTQLSAVVFVVDSNDLDRVQDVRQEIEWVLHEDRVVGVPLLVFANKQDLPNALSTRDVADKLGLHQIRDRKWYIQESVATEGKGIAEGFGWLAALLSRDLDSCASASSQGSSCDGKPPGKGNDSLLEPGDSRMMAALTQTMASKMKLWMNLL
mmetsp:Transcript_2158/g.3668  ORF Transcript_2158/g.3668 Transcript_2158/m.3668 type:complete len:230 (+) Transcript_2158:72-761(+)